MKDKRIEKIILLNDLEDYKKDQEILDLPQDLLDKEMQMMIETADKFGLSKWFNEVLFRGVDELTDEFVKSRS